MIWISRQKGGKGKWVLETPWGGRSGDLVEMFDGAHRVLNISGEDRPITWKRFETDLLEVYATTNEGGSVEFSDEGKGEEDLGMFGEVSGLSEKG